MSFLVGREIPKITICIAFGEELAHTRGRYYQVYLSINGCEKKHYKSISNEQIHEHLWLFSISSKKLQEQLNNSHSSERNRVVVTCETHHWIRTPYSPIVIICFTKFRGRHLTSAVPLIIERWGVHVECICCPEKSGDL